MSIKISDGMKCKPLPTRVLAELDIYYGNSPTKNTALRVFIFLCTYCIYDDKISSYMFTYVGNVEQIREKLGMTRSKLCEILVALKKIGLIDEKYYKPSSFNGPADRPLRYLRPIISPEDEKTTFS